jgi:hypothetical protein
MRKSINDIIRFHLAETGWYVGESKIEFFEESLIEIGIDPSMVSFQNIDTHGAAINNKIYLKESLKYGASLVQLQFIALHEYFHIRLGHCVKKLNMNKIACHAREYACDRLALKHLAKSCNRRELRDAIETFREIIVDGESDTHPSSEDRYNRLLEYMS